jgi:hypothetical protein
LARQLAGYLSVPVFLVDPLGNLLFYNEPAEVILGRRFEETGAQPHSSGSSRHDACDAVRDTRLACRPRSRTARYGGNTSSVEVRGSDGTLLLLDAGTGIRRLGRKSLRTQIASMFF